MSSPLPPTRPRGEALPIVGGLFATGALHVVASILIVVIVFAPDGVIGAVQRLLRGKKAQGMHMISGH